MASIASFVADQLVSERESKCKLPHPAPIVDGIDRVDGMDRLDWSVAV
jgi:hypothetical protein